MENHMATGKKGELLAACWLTTQGYQILLKNWRHRCWEIDIIARKKGVLHFIEVKTRRSVTFGFPEEHIDRRKLKSIFRSSKEFLSDKQDEIHIRYDILSVLILNTQVEYFFIEDVFSSFPAAGI